MNSHKKLSKKNKVGNRRAGSRNGRNNSISRLAPPPFVAQSLRHLKVRTIATGVFLTTITIQQLAELVGVIANTATTSSMLSPLIKLDRISIWGPVTTAGTSVSIALQWVNMSEDFETPPMLFSDSSVSFDRPAHLCLRPPKLGLSSKWHASSLADPILSLSGPSGSTVDFEISFLLPDSVGTYATINGPTLVAASVGQLYHISISTLVPVFVNHN